jgi:peptidyl-prolyl cis-trans isomerase SurA
MKIRSILTFIVLILSWAFCHAQYDEKRVLMTIAGRNVESGEFVRMYSKSIDPSHKEDLKEYLDQFIAFKLKVAEAINEGYDTTRAFREELNGYRNQLAQSYLTDPDIREKLLKKAYERYKWEVNASHILISCRPDASPADTLKAYHKAVAIRERLLNGEAFDLVAREVSDDRSVQSNGGNLGYFTVFQMITPFEDAAYNLEPGSVSMPVRTNFGYHIIRVNDKRPARGKIKVAHIMKAIPPGSDQLTINRAESEIKEIYSLLLKGESFSNLARERSDHKETASVGGEMNWFGTGEIIPGFSEPAFALKDTGDITLPFKTVYGFHIIKLLDRKPPGTWEEIRPSLEAKLNQANISALGKKSFIAHLKKEYNFRIDTSVHDWFVKNTDTLILRGIKGYNTNTLPQGNIFSFADKSFSSADFASYLEKRRPQATGYNPAYFIDLSLDALSSEELTKYENSMLEIKYPDFKYLIAEFHDGILLFDISSDKIWNRVQDDTTGLRNYYLENKNKYLSGKSIEGKLYLLRDQKGERFLASAFRKYRNSGSIDSLLLSRFNSKGDTMLVISSGKWFTGDDKEIDKIAWSKGTHKLKKDGFPAVIKIEKVNEPAQLPFSEVQADVISGYQDWLTEDWIEQLKKKYTIEIDSTVYENVRKKLENE